MFADIWMRITATVISFRSLILIIIIYDEIGTSDESCAQKMI